MDAQLKRGILDEDTKQLSEKAFELSEQYES